jgi:hypothetical protein
VRGERPAPAWKGSVKLASATIRARPPAVDLAIDARGRDARPIVALCAAVKGDSPAMRTAFAIVPDAAIESATAGLVATARVHATKGLVTIHGLDVHGASTRVRGEMTARAGAKSGGFLFEAGPVAVGVALEGEGAKPIVQGAREWFAGLVPSR